MSTAKLVPETRELTGDDAWRVLHVTGEWRLLRDAFRRAGLRLVGMRRHPLQSLSSAAR